MKSKKILIPIISSIVTAAVGAGTTYYAVNQYNEKTQIRALKQEVAKLKDRYEKAKRDIEAERAKLESIINQIQSELETSIREAKSNVEKLKEIFTTLRTFAKYEIKNQEKVVATYYLAYYENDEIKPSSAVTTSLTEAKQEIPELQEIKKYKDAKNTELKDKELPEQEAKLIIEIIKDLQAKIKQGFDVLIKFLNDKKNEYDTLISKLEALKAEDFYSLLKIEGLDKNSWDALDEAQKIQKIKDALTNKNEEINNLIQKIEAETANLRNIASTAQAILDRLQGKKNQ
ncbi:coiled-coil domain-containing protein [Mycoplasma yeatsii]|uniref:DNA repair exonuclease SbcCD ATPase subunit n=1 Tax=Mycoplasma yeatsii TaxID=51365 RepID=A0ABU0NE62_9MOLU|nr:hypothetical protein [Mycoplasma yeatsii]MDQ0567730.1 DNA repair exonuclease SbcCD ATPase subunit [Mycoplasma yeatsii]